VDKKTVKNPIGPKFKSNLIHTLGTSLKLFQSSKTELL